MTTSCSATIGQEPGAWGFTPIICRQQVGVRVYVTTGGALVGFCAIDGHRQNVTRRFPEADEPRWLHEDPEYMDGITMAKAADEYPEDTTYASWFARRVR